MSDDTILPFEGALPELGEDVYIAEGARVIGNVELGDQASVWYNAVLRGDLEKITIGARTNVQDGTVIHIESGQYATNIGEGVTIGHKALVHACTIGDNCLIGMGSIILDGAVIEDNCLVAAGAVVTPGKTFPAGSLIMGTPAKVVRELSDEEIEGFRESAAHYVELARRHRDS
jgi:carbonic anhydrase/acetyltransferase-like protein (isoleucine patch superfamily)